MTLLSVDWDAFSGTRELVFDAPIWGSRDRAHDRVQAWRERARRRGGSDGGEGSWDALAEDFPLYPAWEALERYRGRPAFVTLSHAEAWSWLERFPDRDVLNVDSHHDLASFSGDPARVRPGNWAGLALAAGRVQRYRCLYPAWHAGLPVAEGYDLARTWAEVAPLLAPELLERVSLTRAESDGDGPPSDWPDPAEVEAVLLVQSPAWSSPAHDPAFHALAGALRAQTLGEAPLRR